MDTYLFNSPIKALLKWIFLLFTYFGSIVFKQFTISVVLPTVFLYLLSNLSDYAELAFTKNSKARFIKNFSFIFFLILATAAVLVFSAYNSNNDQINTLLNEHYAYIYIFCAFVWLIPLIDGIRGFFDQDLRTSIETTEELQSTAAYDVMKKSIINK